MAASSRLTYSPRLVSTNPRLSPTSVAYLRFPAADFPLRSNSSVFSADSSSLQPRNVPVPVVFSDRRRRRSMEPSNVYVASNSTETGIGSQENAKNPSLICAPVMADSIDKMVTETCKAHELGADLVEIRLDWLKDFNPLEDLKTIIKKSPLPTLFTYRPKWEGGQYEGDENERQDVLRLAMELGADYVDVELQVASDFIKSIDGKKPENFRVIVSSHNYQNTPSVEDLNNLVARIQQTGADIVKIATTAVDIADVARMFHITSNSQVPTIGLVMGERGLMSRILCSKFGGYLTFGSLESGKVSAPGQPTIKDLLDLYNFRRIGPDTKVYGVIGKPVSHSISPVVHNQAFKSVEFNGVYVPLLVDNIASFLQAYSSSDFAGFSSTMPHKEAALQCCDEVDPLAKSIGAVNTILRRQSDGKLLGYNTDCIGSISAIEDGLRRSDDPSSVPSSSPLAGKTVVVIGAGGAGNRHPNQKAQAQPAAFSHRTTFWTSCPFCRLKYEYHREHVNSEITCMSCSKRFTAFEEPLQSAQPAKGPCQTNYSFPQQNKIPDQKACREPHKRPENPPTVSSRKASFPMPGSTAKNNGKRKRKNMVECSESSDSESSSESEDVVIDDTMAAQDLGSNGGEQPRRSVRSKRKVSYNENLSDDDVDLVNHNGEGSGKNVETERVEEPEEEKQTNGDHSSTESIDMKEKIKEDQVETSAGANDSEEDLSSGSAAKPNLIDYDDPDFSNFDKLREKSCFQAGQIWAVYDEEEGMPRFYALIRKVTTTDFMLKYVWFEVKQDDENETPNLPVSVGKFEVGQMEEANECSIFSHLVDSTTRIRGRKFTVFPKKGEIWALFKNWDIKWSADSVSPLKHEYEFVEILSDHAEGTTVSVGFLSKVKGFKCVFCPMPKDESNTAEIPPHEFCRFSHSIPSVRLTGTEGIGVTEGWYELDPAALPVSFSQNLSGEEAAQDQEHQFPPSGSAS